MNGQTSKLARSAASVAAMAGVVLGAVAPATAQPKTYDVEHEFDLRTPGNIAPEVRHKYYIDTYAKTDRVTDDPDREKGEHVIGLGLHVDPQAAGPVPSHANANSEADVTALAPGHVAGTVRVVGAAEAVLGRNSASAESYSYSKVLAKGRHEDRRGRIRFKGRWKSSKPVDGHARDSKIVVRDPVVARLTDHTTGEVREWTLISIKSETLGGDFSWVSDMVTTDAEELVFTVDVPGQITPEAGRLRLVVERGVVTESVATGDFAGALVPPVGTPTGFSFALAGDLSVAYDMGGDPNHDLEPELLFDNAAHSADATLAWDNGGYITDLGIGLDGAPVSQVRAPDETLGVPMMGGFSVADDFRVVDGPVLLDAIREPVVKWGVVQIVYVRIWDGNPMRGGVPIAGDMVTNRLLGVRDLGTYRMHEDDDPTRSDMPLSELEIDMSWAPPLEEGQYWIELNAVSEEEVLAIPAVNTSGDENALTTDPFGPTWVPLFDLASGRALDLSWTLFFQDGGRCYADCDGSGVLDVFDFLCFQDAFVAGDPYADCTGDGAHDIFDFLCFQDAFVSGCP